MVLANPTYIHHILMVVADPIHTLPRASFHTHTHTHTHTYTHTSLHASYQKLTFSPDNSVAIRESSQSLCPTHIHLSQLLQPSA